MSDPKLICPNCHSDNVRVKGWVKPNENDKFIESVEGEDDTCYCDDCETNSNYLNLASTKDYNIIGFQVVHDINNSHIHPDMAGSFCVYSLSQANEMIYKNSQAWKLLAISEGDIEEPTMMFEGNPRQ